MAENIHAATLKIRMATNQSLLYVNVCHGKKSPHPVAAAEKSSQVSDKPIG
jgi:hypothetical protein